ncbi:MAG: DUF4093 domain-containing protein, partial [Bacilli bacterium]
TVSQDMPVHITMDDLVALRLAGTKDSKARRDYVCTQLALGHTNSKQLLKRLHMFQISLDTLCTTLQQWQEEHQ